MEKEIDDRSVDSGIHNKNDNCSDRRQWDILKPIASDCGSKPRQEYPKRNRRSDLAIAKYAYKADKSGTNGEGYRCSLCSAHGKTILTRTADRASTVQLS